MIQARLTYRFGPLERRGILGPVRAGQATMLGAGLLAAVLAIGQSPTAGGALLAASSVALATILATAPLAGRTVEEWTPVLGAFALRRIAGQGEISFARAPPRLSTAPRRAGATHRRSRLLRSRR